MPGSTFWSSPSASPCSSPLRRPGLDKPLHERLGDVQRARRDHLNRLRAREEEKEAAEWTFSPHLCGVTEEIARQRRQDQDYQYVYDRRINDEEEQPQPVKSGTTFDYLAYESQRFLQRRMAKQLDLEQEPLAECRFSPRLCENTEELIAHAGLPLDFESRQYVWEEQRQRKTAVFEANKAAEEEQWFKPALKPFSEAIVARLRQRLDQDINGRCSNSNSDEDPVVQRLAVKEIARRKAARLHRTEAFYAQYRFQPSLNPVSRALGRSSTTDELAYNWRGEMARNKAVEEAQLAQPSVSIAGVWEDRRRAKDSLAAEARAAREAEELQACTWQPQLATKTIPTRRRQKQQQSPVLTIERWKQAALQNLLEGGV
eukprot:evm.model.NODE_13595_length_49034_cov_18.208120.11